ncbi:MAG: carboxypeptidase regulatory-like domain-containing protein, partial [Terriglobia bacterium]
MQRTFWTIVLAAAVTTLCLGAAPLWGQSVASAEISGVVFDPSGAAVPNAKVIATQTSTGQERSTVSGSNGTYALPNLPVGPYTLRVTARGFSAYVQTGIVLQVANNVIQNVTLRVGSVAQQVQVNANASMVQTQNASVSNVVDQQRIVDLPLDGRQATQLILISGAAATAPGGDMSGSKNFYSSTTISVAGGQANGTNYLLDGGDNNDTMTNVNLPFPFPDAIQEFSVDTSVLPARYGLHPGGTVNVVTKSGTNQWHGDAFEFLRNGAVNARNFFAATQDSLKRNQFGGTVGGPIKKDKLFFFFGYQGTRNRQNPPQTISHVPTAATLAGDFSAMDSKACVSKGAIQLKDPITGGPAFTNDHIPASMFSKAALNLVSYLPQTTDPCGQVTYGIPTLSNETQLVGRVDWVRSSKQSLFGRYLIDDYSSPPAWDPKNILVTVNPGNVERAQTFTLGDSYSISPTTLNSFHATFDRRRDIRGPNSQDINASKLGVNMFTYVPDDMRMSVTGYFNIGCGTCAPGFFNVNTWQFADDLDMLHGKHQIAFGVDFIRTEDNTNSGYLQNGDFTFGGLGSGDGLADFLLGYLSNSSTAFS